MFAHRRLLLLAANFGDDFLPRSAYDLFRNTQLSSRTSMHIENRSLVQGRHCSIKSAFSSWNKLFSVADGEDIIPTFESIASGLKSGKYKNLLILCGAGISVSAGIPDFRTSGTGLYDNLQKYNLPYPEAIFELEYYRKNPAAFVTLAKDLWPTGKQYKPTMSHSFIKLLENKGILLRVYTQNIDGLEVLAGVSQERMVECHGHFRSASCIDCGAPYDIDACKSFMLEQNVAPTCQKCGVQGTNKGRVKPDIVFFGEELTQRFISYVDADVAKCDLLLVLGTSLQVYPVAGIPEWVNCPVVLFNRENVGQNFWTGKSDIDVFVEGDCDESVRRLCNAAGWLDELAELHESTLAKIKDQLDHI